jgi:hypothetical protein
MKAIKKLLYWVVVADLFLLAFSMSRGLKWVVSSQTAFLSSLLVTLASFQAYRLLIQKRIADGDIPLEERDELDIIEDKHELFEEEQPDSTADLKAVIKEERKKIGGVVKSAQHVVKTVTAVLSPLRVAAYLFLILGFLYLNKNGYLVIWAYVLGLTVVPLVSLAMQNSVWKEEGREEA